VFRSFSLNFAVRGANPGASAAGYFVNVRASAEVIKTQWPSYKLPVRGGHLCAGLSRRAIRGASLNSNSQPHAAGRITTIKRQTKNPRMKCGLSLADWYNRKGMDL
jgi:hypothetical protein